MDPELEKYELREKELNAEKEHTEVERQKLEVERQELEMREKELASEAEQRELGKAELIMQERLEREKMAQLERLEEQKLALERDKLQCDTSLKSAELDLKEKAQNDEMKVVKRYGDALSQVLIPQPDDVTHLPSYFRGVEEQFKQLKIPTKYRACLVFYLSARARTLCNRLEPEVRKDYERMKVAIMKEYGLTAKCFKFNHLKKSTNDTYILFSSKLRGLLLQYLHECKVTNFDDMVSLIVSDRIKSSLTNQCLKYVLSIQNNLPADKQQWLDPQRLAEIVDEHVSYVGLANTCASYIGQQNVSGQSRYPLHQQNKSDTGGANSKFEGHKPQLQDQGRGKNDFGRRCTLCQSMAHYR